MEKLTDGNVAYLSGKVLSEPAFNHKTYGEAFYMVLLGILRRSGYEDRIRLIISEKLLGGRSPRIGEGLEVAGPGTDIQQRGGRQEQAGGDGLRQEHGVL